MNENQQLMEETIKNLIELTKEQSKNDGLERVEVMMNPQFVKCNYDERTLTLAYDVEKWELNPQNVMHGGIITTAFDNTFGILSHFFSGKQYVTTVELAVHFHKPILLGDRIEITVKASSIGKTILSYTGECVVVNRENLLASTASTTFMVLKYKTSDLLTSGDDSEK